MVYPLVRPSYGSHHLYDVALLACRQGINVVPIAADGSKRPVVAWKRYQHERVGEREIFSWFIQHRLSGLAFITGAISGGLEALDFDRLDAFHIWQQRMKSEPFLFSLYERIASGYLEETPSGGRHLLYRCQQTESNQKLASRRHQPLIETRGKGGIIIVAPSCGNVHSCGKPYRMVQGGVSTIRTITTEERTQLLAVARTFDETPLSVRQKSIPNTSQRSWTAVSRSESCRPGDVFNEQATWEEVLRPHGWQFLYERDGEEYWTKREQGHVHATTNYRVLICCMSSPQPQNLNPYVATPNSPHIRCSTTGTSLLVRLRRLQDIWHRLAIVSSNRKPALGSSPVLVHEGMNHYSSLRFHNRPLFAPLLVVPGQKCRLAADIIVSFITVFSLFPL